MKVFNHHVYEYCKGLRNLVLHTLSAEDVEKAVARLVDAGIDHVIYPIKNGRLNLFFGASECVSVIRKINKDNLTDYTAEEDFILGMMLGYDRLKQCTRYLRIKEKEQSFKLFECALKGSESCFS